MSTTPVTPAPAEEPKPFNARAFMDAQNERHARPGQPVPATKAEEKTTKVEADTKAEAKPAKEESEPDHRPSRSERRAQNRLREEIGELRGRLKAYEELGVKPKAEAAPVNDPEPQRAEFPDDAAYNRALGRWDARQEARKTVTEAHATQEESVTFREHLTAMDKKASEDAKVFPDWDEVATAEDGPEFDPGDHPTLMGLLATSDQRAAVLYHFAKNPEALEKLLAMTKTPAEQIRQFARLEGRVEKLYDKDRKEAKASEIEEKAAQATDKDPKDRTNPENAEQARATAADRDVRKPKPSEIVTARGGSAAPEEPAIGSPAWMARRNAVQYGR